MTGPGSGPGIEPGIHAWWFRWPGAHAEGAGVLREGKAPAVDVAVNIARQANFREARSRQSKVKKLVDDGVDLAFGLFDFGRQAAFFAFLAKKASAFVSLFQRNFGVECYSHFGQKGFEL